MNIRRALFGVLIWIVGIYFIVFVVEDKAVSVGVMLSFLGYHKLTYKNGL